MMGRGQFRKITGLLLFLIPTIIVSACNLADSQMLKKEPLAGQTDSSVSPEAPESTLNPRESQSKADGAEHKSRQLNALASTSSVSKAETFPIIETPGPDPRPAQVWGEFIGVKTNWEEMKKKLVEELQEEERKLQEINTKLQLIEHLAQNLGLTTKAFLQEQNVLTAEFRIDNQTSYAIKDLSITCEEIAPSGTAIQTHTETVYEIIPPQKELSFPNIHFGNKHPQTQTLRCQITNFTVDNP